MRDTRTRNAKDQERTATTEIDGQPQSRRRQRTWSTVVFDFRMNTKEKEGNDRQRRSGAGIRLKVWNTSPFRRG